jgi:hypothetical protein
MPIYNYIPYIKMGNQFHHVFNNRICMALLIVALAGLISFSSVSSAFAPGGAPWQKIQKNIFQDPIKQQLLHKLQIILHH